MRSQSWTPTASRGTCSCSDDLLTQALSISGGRVPDACPPPQALSISGGRVGERAHRRMCASLAQEMGFHLFTEVGSKLQCTLSVPVSSEGVKPVAWRGDAVNEILLCLCVVPADQRQGRNSSLSSKSRRQSRHPCAMPCSLCIIFFYEYRYT